MTFTLEVLPDTFAICRLNASHHIPDWALGDFVSITRTTDELTIVCRQEHVPDTVRCEARWRCLKVAGTLDFSLVGVIAYLTGSLAAAGTRTLVVSERPFKKSVFTSSSTAKAPFRNQLQLSSKSWSSGAS